MPLDKKNDYGGYRTGAKGSAKPKSCAKCGGKGFVMQQTQVSRNIANETSAHSARSTDRTKPIWYIKGDVHRLRG